jgi:diphthamide synthase (EF-2-diphthine--ammonia ligase)
MEGIFKMYLASWSGGKDSTLAVARAIENGIKVTGIANFISDDYKRVRFHGTKAEICRFRAFSARDLGHGV